MQHCVSRGFGLKFPRGHSVLSVKGEIDVCDSRLKLKLMLRSIFPVWSLWMSEICSSY